MATPHRQKVAFVTLLVGALFAQFQTTPGHDTRQRFEEPHTWTWTATSLRAAFLGHDIFASSVMWSAALIYFGDWRLSGTKTPPKHLLDYANLITDLDPDFEPVFFWLSTTYINSRINPTMRDLHNVSDYLERAIERFPSNCEYPFMAGSNYVGYSAGRPPRERIEELSRALSYYERASLLKGCPPLLPFTLSYFYRHRSRLTAQLDGAPHDDAASRARHRDFLKSVFLLSTDEETRKRARSSLQRMGLDASELDALGSVYTQPLERARARTHSYLPLDHWTLIVAPTERPGEDLENAP